MYCMYCTVQNRFLAKYPPACSVHPGLAGYHGVELLGGRVCARARVDQVHAPRLLDGEREHQVLETRSEYFSK